MKNPYSAASIPEQQRYFTTKEVAEMAGISHYHVYFFCKKLGIDYEVKPTSNSRAAYFSWLNAQKIIDVASHKKTISKAKKELIVTDEEQNAHPLVTDPRWLKLNEWPEVVPSCFEELDRYVN